MVRKTTEERTEIWPNFGAASDVVHTLSAKFSDKFRDVSGSMANCRRWTPLILKSNPIIAPMPVA